MAEMKVYERVEKILSVRNNHNRRSPIWSAINIDTHTGPLRQGVDLDKRRPTDYVARYC